MVLVRFGHRVFFCATLVWYAYTYQASTICALVTAHRAQQRALDLNLPLLGLFGALSGTPYSTHVKNRVVTTAAGRRPERSLSAKLSTARPRAERLERCNAL